MATKNFVQVTLTTTPQQIFAANANRLALMLDVLTAIAYLGKDGTLTAQNGFPWRAEDEPFADEIGATDALWGVTSGGTVDVRGVEWVS